jgi:hypothetical protein
MFFFSEKCKNASSTTTTDVQDKITAELEILGLFE